jgi:hypothetical protein
MTYNDLKSTNLAFASKAWRNGGIKAPITVMYECTSPTYQTMHQRMISRALGNERVSNKTYLVNYTEETFNRDFMSFGFSADAITGSFSEAVALNLTHLELYGENAIIRRIDTIDEALVMNVDGSLKPQWSIKQTSDGELLTFGGAQIYTTTEFADPGTPDLKIQQDQILTRSVASITNVSTADIKENKVKAKATIAEEVEAAF